ncbi:MAG: hypothetical protein ACAI38_25155 [Myxococcota bacterium]|nr:hypothetical protein [Myxococcota bacterium]
MAAEITARAWTLYAAKPEARDFTERLARDRTNTRDPMVRDYALSVNIHVDREKAQAVVTADTFGTAALNAAAAAAIIGDVKAQAHASRRYEVMIANSPMQTGLAAALAALMKDAGAVAYPGELYTEPATCFVVTRPA